MYGVLKMRHRHLVCGQCCLQRNLTALLILLPAVQVKTSTFSDFNELKTEVPLVLYVQRKITIISMQHGVIELSRLSL